jgi:hypothetical protein
MVAADASWRKACAKNCWLLLIARQHRAQRDVRARTDGDAVADGDVVAEGEAVEEAVESVVTGAVDGRSS